MIGLPDDDPFVFRRGIAQLHGPLLNPVEHGAQRGKIAVGIPDPFQEMPGGPAKALPEARHEPIPGFPVFVPEDPGQIEGVNPLPEITQRLQIGDASHLAQERLVGARLPLLPGEIHRLREFVVSDDVVGVEIRDLFRIGLFGLLRGAIGGLARLGGIAAILRKELDGLRIPLALTQPMKASTIFGVASMIDQASARATA